MSDCKWDYFVSYASADHTMVESFVTELEAPPNSIHCCVSYRDFNAPEMNRRFANWDGMIDFGIEQSGQLVLFMTLNALASDRVQREIKLAVHYGKSLRVVLAGREKLEIHEAIHKARLGQYLKDPQWLPFYLDPPDDQQRRQTIMSLVLASGRDAHILARDSALVQRQQLLAAEHENGHIVDTIAFPTPRMMLELRYIPRPEEMPRWWQGTNHGFYISAAPVSTPHLLEMHVDGVDHQQDSPLVSRSTAEATRDYLKTAYSRRLRLLSPEEFRWALAPYAASYDIGHPFGLKDDTKTHVGWCLDGNQIVAVDPARGPTNSAFAAIWLRRG